MELETRNVPLQIIVTWKRWYKKSKLINKRVCLCPLLSIFGHAKTSTFNH